MHALLLPFPAQGHINPFLYFASQLLLRGCSITFVNTERAHQSMLKARPSTFNTPLDIRFVTIPDGFPLDADNRQDMSLRTIIKILNGIHQQQGFLERLVEASLATDKPISCIACDFFFPWVQDVANKFHIPRVLFWTSNATRLYLGMLAVAGKVHPEAVELDELESGALQVGKREILQSYYMEDPEDMKTSLKMIYHRLEEASHILLDSCQELEASFIPMLLPNVSYVGPCLPPGIDKPGVTDHEILRADLYEENLECLRWLDEQDEGSVLFISFGSVAFFPPSQIKEIAKGIEASNERFLWVARPDRHSNSDFPEGFEDRVKDRGMIIPWAPQLKVLEHKAVGGFLTHCGWNSTVESIFMGVPMVCIPIFADQPINAQLVIRNWKVGMGCKRRPDDGLVDRAEVETVVVELMHGQEGTKIRDRSCHLQALVQHSVSQHGSSHVALTSFVEDIQRLRFPK